VDDPTTLVSFEEAVAAVLDPSTPYDRVYVLLGDGIGGFEWDHCIDDNGEIDFEVADAMAAIPTYYERSPSGKGIHGIMCVDDAPLPWHKHSNTPHGGVVEAYKDARFFSVTGDAVHNRPLSGNGTMDALIARYPKPDASAGHTAPDKPVSPPMSDDEVMQLARGGKNGRKFADLYDRGRHPDPAVQSDDSALDQSLFSMLAFYTQDREQLERIASDSALWRDKWRRPDYLRRTIDAALRRSEFWQPGGTVVRNADSPGPNGRSDTSGHTAPDPFEFIDLANAPTDPPEMLVPGLIVRGLVHSIYAAAGTGKTWTALYTVAHTVAHGEKVVYVDKENGARIIRERLTLMGVDLAADGHLVRYAPFPNAGLDAPTVEAWAAILDREKPSLVVFDSWVGFLASCGLDENSSVDIAKWSEAYASPARSRGIAVLILDHVPKAVGNKTARGSSRKLDYVDVQFEQTSNTFDRDRMGQIKLSKRKDREAWLPGMQVFDVGGKRGRLDGSRITQDTFVFRPIDDPFEADSPNLTNGERSTLEALVDGMAYAEWRAASGKADTTFNRHRAALIDAGVVAVRDDRYYCAPERPHNAHGRNGRDCQDRASNAHNAHHPTGGRVGVPDGSGVVVDSESPASVESPPAEPSVMARVAEYLEKHGRASISIHTALGLRPLPVKRAADALVRDGRAEYDNGVYVWADEATADGGSKALSVVEDSPPAPDHEDPHDAALGILRELGGADELSWRYECETYGYHFDPDEFRDIVEDLVADEIVREVPEDPRFALERASEDGWDDYPDCYAGAATYEAVDM
jgi:hypothetical protein